MISSPIVKLIEAIALQELREVIEPKISEARVGFLSGKSTQVHILRLLGKIRDIQANPNFLSGTWFTLFIDFKSAFDRVNHRILFEKLEWSGVSTRTVRILKLLYNSYHFSLLDDVPRRVQSGVAQGSLVSPLLYDWYIDDLISKLVKDLGMESVFAYADDVALICLGYSDIRKALGSIDRWCGENGAVLNKKKCGILPICRKEVIWHRKELEGVPFVREYKYLGIPLDPALTLKNLVPYLKNKLKKFNSRIGMVLHSVVCTKTKYELWQTYARCHFDYFMPAIALCGQVEKFRRCYSKSLKRALGLPLQIPNEKLIELVGSPSLFQIAAHHMVSNTSIILERFNKCPASLSCLSASMGPLAREYLDLRACNAVNWEPNCTLVVNLLAIRDCFEKEVLGLGSGTYLTMRAKKGSGQEVGTLMQCKRCKVPARQFHFLNECPGTQFPRELLKRSLPEWFQVHLIKEGDFNSFFMNLRAIRAYCAKDLQQVEEATLNLAKATAASAAFFVRLTLSAFDENRQLKKFLSLYLNVSSKAKIPPSSKTIPQLNQIF